MTIHDGIYRWDAIIIQYYWPNIESVQLRDIESIEDAPGQNYIVAVWKLNHLK